jgi:5-methylcytosine-specific restriction endonuclease McrA
MPKVIAFNKKSAYQWYLSSAFWRERRVAAFRRAQGICERCKQRPATQVHHLTYIRVFSELPTDLQALCKECHAKIHQKVPANDNQLTLNFDAAEGDDEPD